MLWAGFAECFPAHGLVFAQKLPCPGGKGQCRARSPGSPSLLLAQSPLLGLGGGGGVSGVLGPPQLMPQSRGQWAVPGCAALAPCVSLLQGTGMPSTGTSRMKVTTCTWTRTGCWRCLGGRLAARTPNQDWISLYCWAPFHATLMAIPEGSRCRWDQISSTYSELSSCTQLLAQLLSCPWPNTVLDTFFLQVHAEYFTNCTGAGSPGWAWPWHGCGCGRGAQLPRAPCSSPHTQQSPEGLKPGGQLPSPCLPPCPREAGNSPFPPSPGN
ncbi:uncharacterized protein LOC119158843 [Falco rusticolus]|uniref:uncharacterized protein LOC119158843 n=1 Tax=Falco rusticolus TaxID=120794 RepID=UPI0018868331|nr:uncharacterized protein LOC119158843 [Falco rusticolus]